MPITPTIQNVQPTVGGSADTWGGTVNARLQEAYVDITDIATQVNSNTTVANAALPKSGGTSTGDQILANVGPTSAFSAGYRGAPPVIIDVDRTFQLSDAGKMIRLFGSNVRTWTIPPNSSVAFPIGTVMVLRNFALVSLNIARGVGVQLRVDGSAVDANSTISPYGKASLIQEDTNLWVIGGTGVA